jgi:hypothetical protein
MEDLPMGVEYTMQVNCSSIEGLFLEMPREMAVGGEVPAGLPAEMEAVAVMAEAFTTKAVST